MPVWQETHGPSGDAAVFHANHCCSRPSRYRAARSGLHPSPTETIEVSAKARPVRKKSRRYMATAPAFGQRFLRECNERRSKSTLTIGQPGSLTAKVRVLGQQGLRRALEPGAAPSGPGHERPRRRLRAGIAYITQPRLEL